MATREVNRAVIAETLDGVLLKPLDPDSDNSDTIKTIEAMMYLATERDLTLKQSLIFSPRIVGSRAFEEVRGNHSGQAISDVDVGEGGRYNEEFNELVLKYGACNARSLKEHPMVVFALHETVLMELDTTTSGLITEIMKDSEEGAKFLSRMNPDRLAKILRVFPDEIDFGIALKIINQKKLGLSFVVKIPKLFDQVIDIMDDEGLLGMFPYLNTARCNRLFTQDPFRFMRACKYDPNVLSKYVSPEMLESFRRGYSLDDINHSFRMDGVKPEGIQSVLSMYI